MNTCPRGCLSTSASGGCQIPPATRGRKWGAYLAILRHPPPRRRQIRRQHRTIVVCLHTFDSGMECGGDVVAIGIGRLSRPPVATISRCLSRPAARKPCTRSRRSPADHRAAVEVGRDHLHPADVARTVRTRLLHTRLRWNTSVGVLDDGLHHHLDRLLLVGVRRRSDRQFEHARNVVLRGCGCMQVPTSGEPVKNCRLGLHGQARRPPPPRSRRRD